jgi:hypothetical protein
MRYIAAILFFLYPLFLPAQTVEGLVKNKENAQAIADVVVTLSDKKDNTLAFGFTDKNGVFQLTFDAPSDSLALHFTLLGYESQTIPLPKPLRKLEVFLTPKAFQLKEVAIRPEYVRIKEDTISYNVMALQTQDDRSIGDVMRKIPGLEVSKSGGITYQGNPIGNFYIEGMDLLERKYGIATNNVPADAISSVEVIENHQAIKTLKGEIFSAAPAINLKMRKHKLARPVGTVEAGGGYAFNDLLWQLSAFSLGVGDKSQTILMYKTNNTGEDLTSEFSEQTISSANVASYRPLPAILLNETGFSYPPINESRYLFNQSHVVSLNHLKKTDEDKQFRVNVNYQNDVRNETSSRTSSYFLGDGALVINESSLLERKMNALDGMLTYTENATGRYINDALKTLVRWTDTRSDIHNRTPLSQQYALSDFYIQNDLKFTKKMGGRIWNITSFTRYFSTPQQLTVAADTTDSDFRQKIERGGFFTQNETYIVFNKGLSSLQINGALEASLDHLNTNLAPAPAIFDKVENQLNSAYLKLSLTPQYSFKYNRFGLTLRAPLIFHELSVSDKQYDTDNPFTYFYLDPSLSLSYRLNPLLSISGSGSYTHHIGDITDFMLSYVMPDYTRLHTTSGILAQSKSLKYALKLNHKDPLNGFYYNLNGSYSKQSRNLIAQQGFVDRMIVLSNREQDTSMEIWDGMGYIGKNFYNAKTNVSLTAQYTLIKSERLQQGVAYPHQSAIWSLTPKVSLIVKQYATLSYEAVFSNNSLSISRAKLGTKQTSFNQISQQLKAYYFPNKKLKIKAQAEYLYNEITSSTHSEFVFVDLELNYTHKKLEYALAWDNILNQKEYAYTTYNGLDTYQYTYRLRPQSLLASVRFNY